MDNVDIVIVGAGAAGLMTAVFAGRSNPGKKIVVLDGANKLGAKILVAGGGRCNVTHHQVDSAAYAGASRNAIRKVLRRFDVPETTAFFQECGVALKQEETGKLFPVTDSAKTVLRALIQAVEQAQVQIRHPKRVEAIEKSGSQFIVSGDWGALRASRVVLATGGRSLPKSGSDGHGHKIAKYLGHSITKPVLPALVPLTLPKHHFLCKLSGITLPATFELWSSSGKRLESFTNSTLLTHFGLSGPSVLDISRYYLVGKHSDSLVKLTVNWLPEFTQQSFEDVLLDMSGSSGANADPRAKRDAVGMQPVAFLRQYLPERLARTLVDQAAIEGSQMTREQRKRLVELVTRYPLPITGDRGYNYAEVTAGGVPLMELNLKTMESRICPGLFVVGELCDVDGRIGGFNFQWAWSSGHVAGVSI